MTTTTYAPAEAETWWINHVGPQDIHDARTWVHTRLTAAHLPATTIDDATLIASELLTNITEHAPTSEAELTLLIDDDTLVLTCADRARQTPAVHHPDAQDEHHRGLLIVTALATHYRIQPRRDGGNRVIVHLNLGDTP